MPSYTARQTKGCPLTKVLKRDIATADELEAPHKLTERVVSAQPDDPLLGPSLVYLQKYWVTNTVGLKILRIIKMSFKRKQVKRKVIYPYC